MKRTYLHLFLAAFLFASCSSDDENTPVVEAPDTYTFERNGSSTVSFSGQTTRIEMGHELLGALSVKSTDNASEDLLLEMFRNETENGGDANPFEDADLNASTKSIKSKTAASADFFAANATEASIIKADFESWINAQVEEIFPNKDQAATAGTAGQIADGDTERYVNAQGLEFNQLVNKSLIGALVADQALNNYLSVAVLDEADNRTLNDNGTLADGQNYTTMEHKWDEAYGYLYGTSASPSDPNATIGSDDSFLNKYVGAVNGDDDFAGIADDIFNAFKLGRAAIVAGDYDLRDEQANIIREKISTVIGVRAVYYLQAGKGAIGNQNYGTAFHDLSEAYGFIYSLRFTRMPNTDASYFTKAEVDSMLDALLDDGENGLWDVTPATLENISETIAAKFSFTVAQAGS